MDESLDLVTRVMTPLSEISDDSLMTHEQRVILLIEIALQTTRVFQYPQEKACLLTHNLSNERQKQPQRICLKKIRLFLIFSQ